MKHSNKVDVRSLVKNISQECSKFYWDPMVCEQYAWWLIEAVTGKSRTNLLTIGSIDLSDSQLEKIHLYIDELINQKKPLAYIIGWTPFLDLKIQVVPPLLIPRPETEEWVAHLIELLRPHAQLSLSILDLCTGTGCIGLAIAKAYPRMKVTAVDINPLAVEVASENARMNEIGNIEIVHSDLFNNITTETFDIIISNPPYISAQEFETLDESVKLWEDYKALVADDQGLALIKRIIEQAPRYLRKNKELAAIIPHAESTGAPTVGNLWIEIGHQQAQAVIAYMKQNKYANAHSYTDMSHKERVVIGTYEAGKSAMHHTPD